MRHSHGLLVLAMLLVIAAAFVLVSGRLLPPLVASHFDPGGNANGFMPRNAYLGFMVAIILIAPMISAFSLSALRFIPSRCINLPNKDYWLAPERNFETFAFMSAHGLRFSALLAAFLCFVHWLVVRANDAQPPHFSAAWFIPGLVIFLLAAAFWLWTLWRHFRRRPS